MKKAAIGLITMVMMTLGLSVAFVGTTVSPASAACKPQPYQGCIWTKTQHVSPWGVDRGDSVHIKVRVLPKNGSGTPTGRVKVKCFNSGKKVQSKVRYNGGWAHITFNGMWKRGKWGCKASFNSKVFGNSKRWQPVRIL